MDLIFFLGSFVEGFNEIDRSFEGFGVCILQPLMAFNATATADSLAAGSCPIGVVADATESAGSFVSQSWVSFLWDLVALTACSDFPMVVGFHVLAN